MNVNDLLTLFDYNCWANRRLLKAVERLTPDEITRSVGGAYDSIRTTLLHILEVEKGWLARCGGDENWVELNPDDFPTLDSIKEEWRGVEQFGRRLLSGLSEDDLRRRVRYWFESGEPQTVLVSDLVQHTGNHSSHHRGQVTLMLRMLGHEPGNLDMLFYYAERLGDSPE
ncbi:MAG TPA: DinB family protein [Blastocatellia bacterium]|jgi:uncharacterized damage-inducible protein DinB